jgi:chromate reductase
MQQPEAYIGNAGALFDDEGHVTNDDRRKLLQNFAAAFSTWIEGHRK